MNRVWRISPHFAASAALQPGDLAAVAAAGFRSILSNLPDGETAAFPTSHEEEEAAARAGLAFRHVPIRKADLFSAPVLDGMEAALRELPGPVLAHCASGQRSAVAWAAAAARWQPAADVIAMLKAAGLDVEAMREELADLRDPARSAPVPPALQATLSREG